MEIVECVKKEDYTLCRTQVYGTKQEQGHTKNHQESDVQEDCGKTQNAALA
jgi:hypothetical protein